MSVLLAVSVALYFLVGIVLLSHLAQKGDEIDNVMTSSCAVLLWPVLAVIAVLLLIGMAVMRIYEYLTINW
jgi:hypothetical protein